MNELTNGLRVLHETNLKNTEETCKLLESIESMDQYISNLEAKADEFKQNLTQKMLEMFSPRNDSIINNRRNRYGSFKSRSFTLN